MYEKIEEIAYDIASIYYSGKNKTPEVIRKEENLVNMLGIYDDNVSEETNFSGGNKNE